MKEVAKQRQLPPVYMGKWAAASDAEVLQELEKGTPYTYRFRVPKEGSLKINDLIRGEVLSESSGTYASTLLPYCFIYYLKGYSFLAIPYFQK